MTERSFRTHDTMLFVAATTDRPEKRGFGTTEPDWETFNRLCEVLIGKGFAIGADPRTMQRCSGIAKYHRLGRCRDLWVKAQVYPMGCEFAFFQEIVRTNPNSGYYDFDKRAKMPYLIGKQFEAALAAMKAHLLERGFVAEPEKVASPNPDPLAYFNDQWDSEWDKKRGVHRFERDESGWPAASELRFWPGKDADGASLTHGAIRYRRDAKGYLQRGRVYGGINGTWLFVYGPGRRDFTHASAREFFSCDPRTVPRKQHPIARRVARLRQEMQKAVEAEAFERAARIRDAVRRIEREAVA